MTKQYVSKILLVTHRFIVRALEVVCPERRVRDELSSAILNELLKTYKAGISASLRSDNLTDISIRFNQTDQIPDVIRSIRSDSAYLYLQISEGIQSPEYMLFRTRTGPQWAGRKAAGFGTDPLPGLTQYVSGPWPANGAGAMPLQILHASLLPSPLPSPLLPS